MTITAEELRKVDIAFDYVSDSAIMKLARYVAEKQRAVEPTEEMIEAAMTREDDEPLSDWGKIRPAPHEEIYRAMQCVAPLVVE